MKTLTVTLKDIEGVLHGSATARTNARVSARYTSDLTLTDGSIVPALVKVKPAVVAGKWEFQVYASDDPAVKAECRGFAVVVEAKVGGTRYGGERTVRRTVKPLQARSSPISLGTLDPAEPLPPQWVSVGEVLDDFEAARDAADAAVTTAQQAAAVVANFSGQVAGIEGQLPTTAASSSLSYVVTDRNGRMSWLQADLDGAPTGDALRAVGVARSVNPTVAWTVADAQGRASVLAIGHDGHLTPDSAKEIGEDIATRAPWPRLVHTIGHSFLSDGTLADYIASALGSGWTATTSGVGGETSQAIAARAGAGAWMMHPTGGTIPASGDVNVLLDLGGHGPDANTYWPLTWNGSGTTSLGTGQDNDGLDGIRGTLAGIPGTLRIARPTGTAAGAGHVAGDRYYFRRDAAGAATPCKRGVFRPSYVPTQLGGVVVIMAAQNNVIELDRIMFNISAIIDTLPHDRVIVVGEWNAATAPPGTAYGDAVIAFNKAAADRWGARFVDVRDYARRYALADAGITPTAGDTTDIAAGVIPRSLRRDDIHPTKATSAGYMALARPIVERIQSLGWI